MSKLQPWQPASPVAIHQGITLIEASAGTGKTHNIASLIVRLVAECNVLMREIVVVTFTRAATAELKDRIRERLRKSISVLENPGEPRDDEMMNLLRPEHLPNLRAARESFDECLLSTIHGFCQRMLQQNAFESRTGFDLELLADTSELVEELVDDWLTSNLHADPKRYAFLKESCELDRDTLIHLAGAALRDPDVPVLPAPGETPLSAWAEARDAFAKKWKGRWAKELPALMDKSCKDGTFKKRQSTYTAERCREEMAAVSAWLAQEPPPGVPPNASYFSDKEITERLIDPDSPPSHEAIDAVRGLGDIKAPIVASELATIVQWIRAQFDERMGARRVQSYQDLMRNLARTLGQPGAAKDALVRAIGGRYKAALIDEFQDTDALQWTIFRELFGDARHWLYLIGDPKQAIYGFRGCNVHVYLAARKAAKERTFTIGRNYRSDKRMLEAFHHLMHRPGFFCEDGIDYVNVEPYRRPGDPEDRIRYSRPWGDPFTAPLQLRFIDRRLEGAQGVSDDDDPLAKDKVCDLLPGRIADDIVELLSGKAELYDSRSGQWRGLGPGDFAVLTCTGKQAVQSHAALMDAGVPAVLHGEENVLAQEEALDLQRWLEALASPGSDGPARVAATTTLFGRTATRIALVDAQDKGALEAWETWLSRLARWRTLFSKHGFLHALRTALQEDTITTEGGQTEDVVTRLLRRADGERRLTNLWHIAELVHDAQTSERLALAGVLAWLKRQRAEARSSDETAELRLERDDQAVSVMTMHKSKGLEFPVVFVPYLFDGHGPGRGALLVPLPDRPEIRALDLRADYEPDVSARADRENRKQQLRILYVALTRARLRCVLYAGHTSSLHNTALAAALHGEPRDGVTDRVEAGSARAGAVRSELWNDLSGLCALGRSSAADLSLLAALSACEPSRHLRWAAPQDGQTALQVRNFLRKGLDHTWRRHSYSSLAHGKTIVYVEDGREGFDPDEESEDGAEEERARTWLPGPPDALSGEDVPLAEFPRGAHAGTFLHAIFEKADFRWGHPDSGSEGPQRLRAWIDELTVEHGFDRERWGDLLQACMLKILRTPLGGPLGDVRLCDIPLTARFNELRFDIPLAGGYLNEPGVAVTSEQIVRAMKKRKEPVAKEADELVMRSGWLNGLGRLGSVAGFMTGSMDLVFRHEVEGVPKWFVVDYKSNRLDPHRTGRCPIEHFNQAYMAYAMEQNNYYLQYHIYLLALHRYVRMRMGVDDAGKDRYDYDRDLGGACYLFVRGMDGPPPDAGKGYGCFHDKPPRSVVEELDRLFQSPGKAGAR
jgi:exodeoxyribonuclease V beta subunit